MEEEKNIVEQKGKNNINIILVVAVVVLVLIVLGLTAIIFMNKDKDNKDTENSNSSSNVEVKLTKEELTKIIDRNYYVDFRGEDIVTEGKFDDEVRLKLAMDKYMRSDKAYVTADSEIVLKNNSDFTYDKEEEGYKLKGDPYDMTYYNSETEYYPYEGVNKYYKDLFNTDAPKIKVSYDSATHYYYSSDINGYMYIVIGKGFTFNPEPIYGVKDYKVENNKLIVSVYHATYDWKEKDVDGDVSIVMKNDKNLKYTIMRSKSEESKQAMKDDMLRNHTDKMDVYNFIFDIKNDNYYLNYYLTDIKKA